MKCVWVSGWGVPPDYVERLVSKRFPQASHEVVYPGEHWLRALPPEADVYFGHSLGAFLLLAQAKEIPSDALLILLAPFSDFRAESGQGGRVATVQLRLLLRMLARNPAEALNDFYQRAGLPHHCEGRLPYDRADLVWGIEQLRDQAVAVEHFTRARQCLVGEHDKLLEPKKLESVCPHLKTLPAVGHALKDILPHVKL